METVNTFDIPRRPFLVTRYRMPKLQPYRLPRLAGKPRVPGSPLPQWLFGAQGTRISGCAIQKLSNGTDGQVLVIGGGGEAEWRLPVADDRWASLGWVTGTGDTG